jgi:hypothetical protein
MLAFGEECASPLSRAAGRPRSEASTLPRIEAGGVFGKGPRDSHPVLLKRVPILMATILIPEPENSLEQVYRGNFPGDFIAVFETVRQAMT